MALALGTSSKGRRAQHSLQTNSQITTGRNKYFVIRSRMYLQMRQCHVQGPTSTLYSNRTRIFLSYSNPTRKILKNDRVASSVYYSHIRKIAARPSSQYYSLMDTAEVIVEILPFILSLSSATSRTQIYFQHISVFMMLLTFIINSATGETSPAITPYHTYHLITFIT